MQRGSRLIPECYERRGKEWLEVEDYERGTADIVMILAEAQSAVCDFANEES